MSGGSVACLAPLGFLHGLGNGGGEICGINRFESLHLCRIEQGRRGGDEGDRGAGKHVASGERGAQLQGFGPAQAKCGQGAGARLQARRDSSGCCTMRADSTRSSSSAAAAASGAIWPDAFAPPDGRIHLERSCGRDELAVVLHGFHQPDQRIGSGLAHKQLGEGRSFKKIEAHSLPRSSSIATATGSPCTSTGWKRCASSGMPASARLRRMVVVG